MRRSFACFLGLFSFSVLATTAAPGVAAPAQHRARLEGGLSLAFSPRPAAYGSRRMLPAPSSVPVTIHFASKPTAADAAALRALGVKLELDPDGTPSAYGRFLIADLPASAVDAVAALPRVERIVLDGSPFPEPRPLDGTAGEVEAQAVWGAHLEDGAPLTGAGVTICDIDSPIDVFHPLLFKADGGVFAWIDNDGDGVFTPGVDGVDLNGTTMVLRVLDSIVTKGDEEPLFGSDDPGYALGMDYLYGDANGNGARDFGPEAGFTEADPTYGERLFVADDVNRNGKLDVGEKLVALGTSKVKAFRLDNKIYQRGTDLIDLPTALAEEHGTAVAGELVGGTRGLTHLVGIAPDADLIMGDITSSFVAGRLKLANWCIGQGARVVLHEYAPWVGYHRDGSSPMEQLIDETMQRPDGKGIVHVNPVGNLATKMKHTVRPLSAGAETVVPIEVPHEKDFTILAMSLLWRETSRDLSFALEEPSGTVRPLGTGVPASLDTWSPGLSIYVGRADSSRGTARIDIYLRPTSSSSTALVPKGTWKLRVLDPAPAGAPELSLFGYVMDDVSGWSKGIHFPELASDEYLLGYPSTADHAIPVAAYLTHAWFTGEKGERASYSGRGRRIDGAKLLWISAPADPITSSHAPDSQNLLTTFSGTSGAAPHVAGAAALLLQAKPSLSGDDVKNAIRDGALADDFVGEAPNDDWGYGKLRIYKTIFGKEPPAGSPPSIAIDRAEARPGEPAVVKVTVSDPDEPASSLAVDVDREYDGAYEERLVKPSFTVTYAAEGTYHAKVRVTDSTGKENTALAVIEVKKAKAPPAAVEEKDSGCSLSGGLAPRGRWGLALPALLALLGLHRARRQGRLRRSDP